MAFEDRRAGLRLVVPQGWGVETEGLLVPFTSAAYPMAAGGEEAPPPVGQAEELGWWVMAVGDEEAMPLFDDYQARRDPLRAYPTSPRRAAREAAEERALWAEVLGEEPGPPPVVAEATEVAEDEGWGGGEEPAVFAGVWEEFYEEAPEVGELVPAAAWLASSYGEFFQFFPRHEGLRRAHGLDYGQRRLTVGGRPAAAVAYRFLGGGDGEDGEAAAALRLVVVHLGGERVAFALGLANSREDCRLVDAVLAGMEVL